MFARGDKKGADYRIRGWVERPNGMERRMRMEEGESKTISDNEEKLEQLK